MAVVQITLRHSAAWHPPALWLFHGLTGGIGLVGLVNLRLRGPRGHVSLSFPHTSYTCFRSSFDRCLGLLVRHACVENIVRSLFLLFESQSCICLNLFLGFRVPRVIYLVLERGRRVLWHTGRIRWHTGLVLRHTGLVLRHIGRARSLQSYTV